MSTIIQGATRNRISQPREYWQEQKNLNLENIDDKSKKVAAEEDNHDTEQHDSQTCKGASIWTPILWRKKEKKTNCGLRKTYFPLLVSWKLSSNLVCPSHFSANQMIRIATDDHRPHDVQRPEYQNVKDSKQGEGDEVEEDQVHPGYVDLDVVRVLSEAFSFVLIMTRTI